ncbi:hypothetical protein F5Y14DRAFT_400754 [Nemania sp. NC0429]|nr:hypothetical protein F5Y14DRAFT_400754 [Nemania sp. NC0429]
MSDTLQDCYTPNWPPFFEENGGLKSGVTLQVECGICRTQLAIDREPDDDHESFAMLACGHSFGKDCLQMWLNQNPDLASCPMCRRIMIHPYCGCVVTVSAIRGHKRFNPRVDLPAVLEPDEDLSPRCEFHLVYPLAANPEPGDMGLLPTHEALARADLHDPIVDEVDLEMFMAAQMRANIADLHSSVIDLLQNSNAIIQALPADSPTLAAQQSIRDRIQMLHIMFIRSQRFGRFTAGIVCWGCRRLIDEHTMPQMRTCLEILSVRTGLPAHVSRVDDDEMNYDDGAEDDGDGEGGDYEYDSDEMVALRREDEDEDESDEDNDDSDDLDYEEYSEDEDEDDGDF